MAPFRRAKPSQSLNERVRITGGTSPCPENRVRLPSTLTYNADSQLCWSSPTTVTSPSCTSAPTGSTTYTYDASGNRTKATTGTSILTYTYNEANQLAAYSSGSATSYTYNGDGLRATKTTGGTTQHFTWDRVASTPLLLSDDTNYYLYGVGGQPVEQISSSGTVSWLHHDNIGSTRLITDNTGAVTATATYDPYGTLTTSTGTLSPLGYQGQYADTESGLIYLRARYYDPKTAQFITIDPLVSITQRPYAYAGDTPVNNVDPSGLEEIGGGDGGGYGGGIEPAWEIGAGEGGEGTGAEVSNGSDEEDNLFAAPSTNCPFSMIASSEGDTIDNLKAGRADRGDGRDPSGRFTGRGGYGKDYEERGLTEYEETTGRTVVTSQVRASFSGEDQGRFYDGLSENPDGTYQGIEVKGGSATRTAPQRSFDERVAADNPAFATYNGKPIVITSVYVVNVP